MTVQAQNSVQYYNGPIEIGTELSIVEFTFIDNSHVSAKVRGNTEVWQYGYDYIVSGAQTLIRTITVQRRVAENEVLAVYLDVPITQNISPEEGGNFPASTNEYVLDKLTYISQMLDERLKRSLQISIDTPFSGTLPAPKPNKALKISSDGNSFVMSDYDPDTALVLTEQYRSEAQQSAAAAMSSQNAARASENNAAASATIATQKANQVESIYEEAVPELTSIIDNGVITLSNASNALRTTQITNCITEIPQNIKLELNNGTLTLKKGSKVIVPNGVGVFDEVTITQDISYPTLSHATVADRVIFLNAAKNGLVGLTTADTSSGATQPSSPRTSHFWYDTANNLVKFSSNTGATWASGYSLPICIGNYVKDSGFTSIDQVFNGMGYIGSTVWADKGVKGLAPNGRNEDGTLNNIEFTTQNVLTANINSSVNINNGAGRVLIDSTGTGFIILIGSYDPVNNYVLGGNGVDKIMGCIILDNGYVTNGHIDSFDFKLPFRAVDYNDYRTEVDAKVSKSGDTMTGELFMNGANIRMYQDGISQAINTRNTGFVLADGAPSKAQAGFRMNSTDANGVITHYYQTDNPTNGDTYTAISNTVYVDGGTKYYPFIIGVTGANVPYLKYDGKTMRYITDTYISGTSWYRIYNDGWCEQGGRVTGETVTFLKNFKNTNYMIQKTLASSDQNTTQDRTVSFWDLTVSGATTFVASGYWFACGFTE